MVVAGVSLFNSIILHATATSLMRRWVLITICLQLYWVFLVCICVEQGIYVMLQLFQGFITRVKSKIS